MFVLTLNSLKEGYMQFYKLIFFVPEQDKEAVKGAIFSTGAGTLGEYSHCCWEVAGRGQFMPSTEANPHLGTKQELSFVAEYRVEVLCSHNQVVAAIAALKEAHPYEEPAFEVVKLENPNSWSK